MFAKYFEDSATYMYSYALIGYYASLEIGKNDYAILDILYSVYPLDRNAI